MSLFPEPNWYFIEPHLLKKAVSKRTYKKGLELQGKAVAEELMPQCAKFVIEEQFHSFLVELKLTVYGGFLSRCTCAKSRRGHTCEHVIAGALQAKKLLAQEIAEANQPGRWRRRLEIASRPLTPQLHLETTAQQGLIITTHFSPTPESSSKATDELRNITLQPTWLLYHERYLVQLPSTLPLETCQSLLQNSSFSILSADREDFLDETLPVLAQTFTISGIDIQWEAYSTGTFTPRLFLNKKDGIWLHFLHDYEFGGCLADDMGLGKTIQALAFFQSLRENNHTTKATLIIAPCSLLINRGREANRFTPALRVLIHAGPNRSQDPAIFDHDDLVIATYGVVLRDLEMLRGYHFHYVVLDESQAVKNPIAKTSQAVRMLQSDHRLALTGTPIENTTLELWFLFAFLNPDILGNLDFFREDFVNPIERRKDEETANILRRTVFPFILRRIKQQVAPELPPRSERIIYYDMEPAQRKLYQRWRDYYRGVVLGLIEEEGGRQVHMKILEGLLRLRQIAILPTLVDEKFRGKSSKFEMLLETLDTLQQENHKVLVFLNSCRCAKLCGIISINKKILTFTWMEEHINDRNASTNSRTIQTLHSSSSASKPTETPSRRTSHLHRRRLLQIPQQRGYSGPF